MGSLLKKIRRNQLDEDLFRLGLGDKSFGRGHFKIMMYIVSLVQAGLVHLHK